jgi:UDP-glucuronate 4-epimerase
VEKLGYIIVTGGAGFIGSHLCEALIKQGEKVINIDNFNDYYDPQIKRENVMETIRFIMANSYGEDCYRVKEGDIRDNGFLDRVFSENEIEAVVHLAACAGVRPSIDNPVLYTDVNVIGTVNILEMLKKHNIKRFIFASSSSVYGNSKKVPFSEGDCVDFPISPYAATKKAGELLCHTYHTLYNINVACLRFFNAYGPRQRPDQAIHKFTKFLFEGEELPIYGDGTSERDYTYIDDIIDGCTKAINWTSQGIGKYDIFNLGEANTISLKDVIKEIENATDRKAKTKRLPMQEGDVYRTFADIFKAKDILGYTSDTAFKDGVKEFVKWYRDKYFKV